MESSYIELDRKALRKNINFIKSQLKNKTTLSCVLKGNAYGHGIEEMVKELETIGVSHFSLFSSDEARIAASVAKNPNSTLMIMGAVNYNDLEWIILNNVEVYVFTFERLKKLNETGKRLNKKARIHLEVETGMNRTGFLEEEWIQVINELENLEFIEWVGACTHFAGAESIANFKRIESQKLVFQRFKNLVKNRNCPKPLYHTSCSAALMAYPEEQHDLVRIGILQYGLWPSKEIYVSYLTKANKRESPIKRVINWYSHIMSIKTVSEHEFVGYGMSYLTENDIKIATVPVGYSSGYSRELSNQAKVIINGKRLDVIGIINMNLLVVDITNIENPKIGDRVTLIGKEDEVEISVASFSDYTNKLNYEVLTQIDRKINRKFID